MDNGSIPIHLSNLITLIFVFRTELKLNGMKEKLHKIWKDSVWSKIIAIPIGGILISVYNGLIAYLNETDFITEFYRFWSLQLPLWGIVLFALIVFIIVFFLKGRRKPSKFRYDDRTLEMDREIFDQIRLELFKGDVFQSKPPVKYILC